MTHTHINIYTILFIIRIFNTGNTIFFGSIHYIFINKPPSCINYIFFGSIMIRITSRPILTTSVILINKPPSCMTYGLVS